MGENKKKELGGRQFNTTYLSQKPEIHLFFHPYYNEEHKNISQILSMKSKLFRFNQKSV